MADRLLIEHDGPVLTLVLDRPERRNALSLAYIQQITAALDEAGGRPETRAVLIRATGPSFCAGHDLAEMHGRDEAFFLELFGACTRMMLAIHGHSAPVVAAVQGTASAGGCHLAAACDLVVASADARFAIPGLRIGLPATTALVELVRSIGRRRALELILAGDAIDARTAERWGLVNRVVAPGDLVEEATSLARRIARSSASTLAEGKRAFHAILDPALAQDYARAREVMARASAGPVGQEGIAAFLEKREPVWPLAG